MMIVDGRTARGRRTTTQPDDRRGLVSCVRRGRRDGKGFFLLRSGKRADERRSIGSDHHPSGSPPTRRAKQHHPIMIVAPLGNGGVMTTTTTTNASSSIPPVSTHEAHEIERPASVDGDGIDDARTRSNSFSTEHSDRSDRDVVFAAHHHHHHRDQQPCGAVPYDAHSGERARGGMIQKFPARPSPALEALCASRARDAAPDGPELHACACAEMLVRERERFGDFILDVARAHHAPYRAQLVEWILDVCAGERFAPTTADVAIAFTVRSRDPIPSDRIGSDRFDASPRRAPAPASLRTDGYQPSDRWFFRMCIQCIHEGLWRGFSTLEDFFCTR